MRETKKSVECLETFDDPITGTRYVKGLFYTILEGNVPLRNRMAVWVSEGKFKSPEQNVLRARVIGRGIVT